VGKFVGEIDSPDSCSCSNVQDSLFPSQQKQGLLIEVEKRMSPWIRTSIFSSTGARSSLPSRARRNLWCLDENQLEVNNLTLEKRTKCQGCRSVDHHLVACLQISPLPIPVDSDAGAPVYSIFVPVILTAMLNTVLCYTRFNGLCVVATISRVSNMPQTIADKDRNAHFIVRTM
jgi:hypothetical protein